MFLSKETIGFEKKLQFYFFNHQSQAGMFASIVQNRCFFCFLLIFSQYQV